MRSAEYILEPVRVIALASSVFSNGTVIADSEELVPQPHVSFVCVRLKQR